MYVICCHFKYHIIQVFCKHWELIYIKSFNCNLVIYVHPLIQGFVSFLFNCLVFLHNTRLWWLWFEHHLLCNNVNSLTFPFISLFREYCWCCCQTSFLSQISQIISVEKNLSCGEISDFCKEFEQFMEFYRNLCRFCSKFVWRKSLWRKNDKYEVCYIVQYTLHPVQGYIFCHLKK